MISGFCLEVEEKGSGSLLGLGTIFRAVKEDLKALQGKEKRTMVAIGGGGLGKLNCLDVVQTAVNALKVMYKKRYEGGENSSPGHKRGTHTCTFK